MKTIPPSIFQFLGVNTNGDVGPYTIYTSARKRLVVFLKTWPKDPATYNQNLNRNRWRHAAARWRSLSTAVKDDWTKLARNANVTVTGYNLFMFYMLDKDIAVIRTLEQLTRVDVIAATGDPLPHLTA